MYDNMNIGVEGHLLIKGIDPDGEKVLLDKRNAIHKEHMSLLIANSIANQSVGGIYAMFFGSGGAAINSLGEITYATPNVSGNSDLNTPVYNEIVDQTKGAPEGNLMRVNHTNGTLFSDVLIKCVLGQDEPPDQRIIDSTSTTIESSFFFDEIGLKAEDGRLLTHIVFAPIEKTRNRIIEIVYTIRVTIQ